MGVEYFSREDLRMRLDRTIVSYDGKFYYATVPTENSKGWFLVTLTPLGSKKKSTGLLAELQKVDKTAFDVDHRDEKFSAAATELGYINWEGAAYYPMRIPLRRQQQGLNADHLAWAVGRRPGSGWFTSLDTRNMLENVYPKFETVLKTVQSGLCSSMAFHRDFAIEGNPNGLINLMFKGRGVGYYDHTKQSFVLFPTKEASFINRSLKNNGLIDNGKVAV